MKYQLLALVIQQLIRITIAITSDRANALI